MDSQSRVSLKDRKARWKKLIYSLRVSSANRARSQGRTTRWQPQQENKTTKKGKIKVISAKKKRTSPSLVSSMANFGFMFFLTSPVNVMMTHLTTREKQLSMYCCDLVFHTRNPQFVSWKTNKCKNLFSYLTEHTFTNFRILFVGCFIIHKIGERITNIRSLHDGMMRILTNIRICILIF